MVEGRRRLENQLQFSGGLTLVWVLGNDFCGFSLTKYNMALLSVESTQAYPLFSKISAKRGSGWEQICLLFIQHTSGPGLQWTRTSAAEHMISSAPSGYKQCRRLKLLLCDWVVVTLATGVCPAPVEFPLLRWDNKIPLEGNSPRVKETGFPFHLHWELICWQLQCLYHTLRVSFFYTPGRRMTLYDFFILIIDA